LSKISIQPRISQKKEGILKGWERFQTALDGYKPDRIPFIVGNYNTFLSHFYGAAISQLLEDSEFFAELSVQFAREFGFDSIRPNVGYIFYGCGPELGIKWKLLENNLPGATSGCIENKGDLLKLKVPKKPTGYFKKFLNIHRIIVKEIGNDIYVRGIPLGPFSVGCFIRGLENFLLDSAIDIDFFRLVLKKGVDLSNYFVQKISSTGVRDLILNEVFLTPGNLSPRFFQEEINPMIQTVIAGSISKKLYFRQQDFIAEGNLSDGTPKKGLASAIYYGTKESLDVIQQTLKLPIPGYPPLVTISGRNLVRSSINYILDFINQGVEIILKAGAINPCIHLSSVQISSKEEAMEIASKIIKIQELRDKLSI
jgi:hypothetical protein